jgi:hypothetical protein
MDGRSFDICMYEGWIGGSCVHEDQKICWVRLSVRSSFGDRVVHIHSNGQNQLTVHGTSYIFLHHALNRALETGHQLESIGCAQLVDRCSMLAPCTSLEGKRCRLKRSGTKQVASECFVVIWVPVVTLFFWRHLVSC